MKKYKILFTIIYFIISSFCIACQSNINTEDQNLEMKVQNLETFAQLYGYARWFHPSDEAQEIDWDKFAILGVQKVENIKSSAALRDTLYWLFSPIVQGLQIYDAGKSQIFNSEILLSPDPNSKVVAWQHYGVYLNEQSNIYKSVRTNKSDSVTSNTTIEKTIIGASQLNGKEVKFSGYFKCKKGYAKLFVRYSNNGRNFINYEVPIESEKWENWEITQAIPQKTTEIIYGFEVDSSGVVWADDLELAVNNGGKWELVNSSNMEFESAPKENEMEPIEDWERSMIHHIAQITDENPHSGKYCLKISYTGKKFDYMPQFGEITKELIGNNLICVVPLALQTNGNSTYPKTELASLNRLKSDLSCININSISNPEVNLASVIITWNVLQHFFPYFDVIDTDWKKVLGETLKNTFTNKRQKDFFITMRKMIAQIDDGHGNVNGEYMYCLPVRFEVVENKIIITASEDTNLKRGDIIHKINGKQALEVLAEEESLISGSIQLRRYRALNILAFKLDSEPVTKKEMGDSSYSSLGYKPLPSGTSLVIERDGQEQNVSVSNSTNRNIYFNPINERKYSSETIIEIEPEIYYVNMSKCTVDNFEAKKTTLANAKAVIYDQRDNFKLTFFDIIPYLIQKQVTSAWWNVPQTVYPNRKRVEFTKSNWNIKPKEPFFKSKSIIITTPNIMSSGETTMSIINHYHLATTVGKTTGGCNGNANIINLPCGYSVWWTGMKVLKHDGSQLYLKGFKPDFPVNESIQAIKEGRDEYLEKALEIARQE